MKRYAQCVVQKFTDILVPEKWFCNTGWRKNYGQNDSAYCIRASKLDQCENAIQVF